ncbi:hypothetical protein D3C87_1774290 [compost metagenome]
MRTINPVKHPILCSRGQHFQRNIGNIDFKLAVFGDSNTLGNSQSRSRKHAVRDHVCGFDRLRISIG